ncbi:FAD binding domain-containing protein [Demequina aurantiaca]|uniref:FAD binding domain-containing protein n=1 Tax=Demequina aurantiaca TaxID=676200 RepID=UPI003D33B613
MDLGTVTKFREATTRTDLHLHPGERFIAGGTWMYSEPQPGTSGLVDLTGMGWADVEISARGDLSVAATCTIAALASAARDSDWAAAPLFEDCANALLASFKIWNAATVGGNICRAYAAASMVALSVTLDAQAEIWHADGSDSSVPVTSLIAGNGVSTLRDGDVLRAINFPAHALAARTASRKIALAEHGRSGALLAGRLDADSSATFVITAATSTPTVLRFSSVPSPDALDAAVRAVTTYYTDALGSADWRRQVSAVLLAEVLEELTA